MYNVFLYEMMHVFNLLLNHLLLCLFYFYGRKLLLCDSGVL